MKQIRTPWRTKIPLHTEVKIQLNTVRRNEKSKWTSKLFKKVLLLVCLLTRQESRSRRLTYFPCESGNLESIQVSKRPMWDRQTLARVYH